MEAIVGKSATQLAAAIKERCVSAVEVIEAHLAHIERHNPSLNAIVTLDAEGALQRAKEVDRDIARGIDGGPLHGIPVTLKDCHATAGMRTTAGSPDLADYVPAEDGTIATRLRAAGAIILGKTNVAELMADVQTSNPIFGRTNNPWDLTRTPGGSSGGAAAAVAAGLSVLDIGSDIGGSIRYPAHYCGVFGLKPTEHRVSNYGHIPDLPDHPRTTRIMNCNGPLARSVDDLDLALRVIAGPDNHDLDVPPVPIPPLVSPPISQLRIACATCFPGLPVSSDVHSAITRVARDLANLGARVEEALPRLDFEEQLRVRAALRMFVRMLIEDPPDGPLSAEAYFRALDARDGFTRTWEQFFTEYDALICPVTLASAFPHCEKGTPIVLEGETYPYSHLSGYCRPFSLTGHPVVTLPVGLDTKGLPIGVQLVGARWSEAKLLGIAQVLQSQVPGIGFQQPPVGDPFPTRSPQRNDSNDG